MSQSVLSLRVEPKPGIHIDDVMMYMWALAKRIGFDVVSDCNGDPLTMTPRGEGLRFRKHESGPPDRWHCGEWKTGPYASQTLTLYAKDPYGLAP